MRRILILVSLLVVCAGAAADTRKGYDAYNSGDFKAAIEEFRKSAQQGDGLAMFYLGESYYNGRGVQQDFAKAAEWYQKAAQQNDARAQASLAFLYYSGKGVAQNESEAVK